MITRLKSFVYWNWPIVACVLIMAFASYSATIGTLGQLPTSSGGVFTQDNLDKINSNYTQANTNFTNLNNAVGGGLNGLTITTTTGTLTIANSKTLTASNTLTLAGTDATTVTFPSVSVGVIGSTFADCASTAACPSTVKTTLHVVQGIGLLATGSPSTYAVTTISPAFSSSTSYNCFAQDVTTIATNIGVLSAGYVSGSAVTFTGPNTNTDTFRWTCVGY